MISAQHFTNSTRIDYDLRWTAACANLEVLHVQAVSCDECVVICHRLDLTLPAVESTVTLSQCRRLQVLRRVAIRSQPYSPLRLRSVSCLSISSLLDDVALSEATHLVSLQALHNSKLTTVAPFGSTLIELNTSFDYGIDDVGLATATNLVSLKAIGNARFKVWRHLFQLLELQADFLRTRLDNARNVVMLKSSRVLTLSPTSSPCVT